MSRRDTIIIAVLLNAGLLVVLFVTSLKSNKTEEPSSAITVVATHEPEVAAVPQIPTTSLPTTPDTVDQVIQQYVTPQVATENQPNFLADLQAIGLPPSNVPEPSAVPEPTSSQPSFKEVKVKKGDVLERIARQNHVSVGEIMKANKLSTSRLRIGQTLKIPTKGATTASAAAPVSSEGEFYTVKNGDNPWTIAVKHHMKVEDLLKLNQMDEAKARRLKPGDRLRVK